jgi:hypothetical protein
MALAVVGLSLAIYLGLSRRAATSGLRPLRLVAGQALDFAEPRQRAAELISYDRSIALSAAQQRVMSEALSSIPAPCCAKFSIATCCCPCNLAKSTWGLAKVLIARQQASASQVKDAARQWLEFTNSAGYRGDACFTGGCERPFDHNGCGGMNEEHLR